jgi:hypothetical protein
VIKTARSAHTDYSMLQPTRLPLFLVEGGRFTEEDSEELSTCIQALAPLEITGTALQSHISDSRPFLPVEASLRSRFARVVDLLFAGGR